MPVVSEEPRVEQVHPRVHRLDLPYRPEVNVQLYLLQGDQLALVDCGAKTTPSTYLALALAHLGLRLGDVDVAIDTHGHADHLGGNAALAEAGAKLALHAADRSLAEDPEAHRRLTEPLRFLGLVEAAEATARQWIGDLGPVTAVSRWLADGDEIDLGRGLVLKVLEIPGHSAGSIALYWERDGLCITGDGVQVWGAMHRGPLYWDGPAYRSSMARLASLDIDLLLMGHGFYGPWPTPKPVRDRSTARLAIEESRAVAGIMREAIDAALSANPDAPPIELARAAVPELLNRVATIVDRRTKLPPTAAISLASELRDALKS